MKLIYCLAFAILFSIHGSAQDKQGNNGRNERPQLERIHAIKVAYITDRLHLTVEQSQQFWPVYNAYEKEHIALKRSFMKKYKDADKDDDEVSRQMFDDRLDMQAGEVDLKRKYKEQFLKILSPQQLLDLFKAEGEFVNLLKQRLKDKGWGGNQGGGMWQNSKR